MGTPWTEAHQREAQRRTYEIAAELVGAGHVAAAWMLVPPSLADGIAQSEEFWRDWLGTVSHDGRPLLDPARIDREVRRVRGLAEGRLVREREETWKVVSANGIVLARERLRRADALAERGYARAKGVRGDHLVKVTRTRIRKAGR
jgi:hypothetical protein